MIHHFEVFIEVVNEGDGRWDVEFSDFLIGDIWEFFDDASEWVPMGYNNHFFAWFDSGHDRFFPVWHDSVDGGL